MRKKLIEAAKKAQKNSYSPYSRYPVGAAVLTESGRIYSGCNVENASFGLACCAERTAIFNAVSHGEKKLRAVCVAAKSASPCGACRQVMIEFALKDAELICVDWQPLEKKERVTYMKLARVLPFPFNPSEAGL
ncbi:MAG: cytidine deaminase [Elusimicrobia bacterium RIFOXYB2_FULL_62_6]|nr:MAG: cytidine deaminase [Elusimicrobia bacterium RIFOXYB2_FULL_62_6]